MIERCLVTYSINTKKKRLNIAKVVQLNKMLLGNINLNQEFHENNATRAIIGSKNYFGQNNADNNGYKSSQLITADFFQRFQ